MSDSYEGPPPQPPPLPVVPFAVEPPAMVDCWRCGKRFVAAALTCPFCRARNTPPVSFDTAPVVRETLGMPPIDPTSPVVRLIGYYAALLVTSIVFAMVLRGKFSDVDELSDADRIWLMYVTFVIQAIDTVIVILAWQKLQRPEPPPSAASPVAAWIAGLPLLALLLGLNFGYHGLLIQMVPSLDDPEEMLPGREWMYLISYGLQPAIVEEAFFRGLALDWFRTVTSTRAALVVSSVMFGMCHIYAPISVPYLITAGLVFGAARIYSGGLVLPMVLHFLHNLVVVLFDHYRA